MQDSEAQTPDRGCLQNLLPPRQMPPGFTAQIVGLKELDQKLSELKTTQATKIIRDGLKAGGGVFQAAIQERAPERPDVPAGDALPPGALAQDIEIHMGKDGNGLAAAIVTPGKYTAHVANMVEYGHRIVRNGYSHQVVRGGKLVGYRGPGRQLRDESGTLMQVPEHPFIRPAYEAVREEAVTAMVKSIAQGVEKAANK